MVERIMFVNVIGGSHARTILGTKELQLGPIQAKWDFKPAA